MKFKRKIVPWLFVLPAIISILLLKYYPILKAFIMSLHEYDFANPPGEFVGFKNYKDIIEVGFFWNSWYNTLIFLMITLLISFIPPIIQAIFLNETKRFNKLFRALYILPVVIPISVTVIIWKWIWHPDYGMANVITRTLGFGEFAWLNDPTLAKFCLVFPGILGGGIAVFVYLAAIQGIPEEIFEAAVIDGIGQWKKIFLIIIPNITFVILIQLIITVIGVLQMMDLPFQMTNGGPSNATSTVALTVYEYAEKNMNYGYATAASFMLMFVILIITTIQVALNKSETN